MWCSCNGCLSTQGGSKHDWNQWQTPQHNEVNYTHTHTMSYTHTDLLIRIRTIESHTFKDSNIFCWESTTVLFSAGDSLDFDVAFEVSANDLLKRNNIMNVLWHIHSAIHYKQFQRSVMECKTLATTMTHTHINIHIMLHMYMRTYIHTNKIQLTLLDLNLLLSFRSLIPSNAPLVLVANL